MKFWQGKPRITKENQAWAWKGHRFLKPFGSSGSQKHARWLLCSIGALSGTILKFLKILFFSSRLFFLSAERFSSKFSSSNLYLPHITVLKEILYKSSRLRVLMHIWRVAGAAINIGLALRKNDFIRQKMWFKYDCMVREHPPVLHKISEKFFRFIKSDYNVPKPMWMHRFSWKLRAFWWFSLSELYKGKSQQPTRLPRGQVAPQVQVSNCDATK